MTEPTRLVNRQVDERSCTQHSALSPQHWRSWGPFLIPPLYLALVFALQPVDRLGDPGAAPWLGRLVYDDYDMAALALRGLNATLGRTPGRGKEPPRLSEAAFCQALDTSQPAGSADTPY